MCSWRAGILALLALAGCDPARADDEPRDETPTPVEAEAAPPAASAPQALPPVASLPSAAAPEAKLDARAAMPPSAPMPRTTALMLDPRARIGVTLGHPPGFLLDNPSLILMWQRGDASAPKIVVKRLGGAGLDDARIASLMEASGAVGLRAAEWSAFEHAVAGARRWPARIASAAGKGLGDAPRRALAVIVEVPTLESVGILGAWPAGADAVDHTDTVLDVVRHLERCRVVVGSGCVPWDDETSN